MSPEGRNPASVLLCLASSMPTYRLFMTRQAEGIERALPSTPVKASSDLPQPSSIRGSVILRDGLFGYGLRKGTMKTRQDYTPRPPATLCRSTRKFMVRKSLDCLPTSSCTTYAPRARILFHDIRLLDPSARPVKNIANDSASSGEARTSIDKLGSHDVAGNTWENGLHPDDRARSTFCRMPAATEVEDCTPTA